LGFDEVTERPGLAFSLLSESGDVLDEDDFDEELEEELPAELCDARRITDPEEEDPAEEPEEDPADRADPRATAGITPEARGAGIGRGVCTEEALPVTRNKDPGAGAL
jgi:hypothetical protein